MYGRRRTSKTCAYTSETIAENNIYLNSYSVGGALLVTKGSGGYNSASGVSPKQAILKITCEEAIAAFAAIQPSDYSSLLSVIISYIGAAKSNYSANGGTVVGASDADIFNYLKNTVYPDSPLTQQEVTDLVTRGTKLGIFRLASVMCTENPPTDRVVCIDLQFGYYPQNKSLYVEMGSTPYYPFAIGIL